MVRYPETRRCSRCGGNLFIDNDNDGWYQECLQCGNHVDLENVKKDFVLQTRQLRTTVSGIDNTQGK